MRYVWAVVFGLMAWGVLGPLSQYVPIAIILYWIWLGAKKAFASDH